MVENVETLVYQEVEVKLTGRRAIKRHETSKRRTNTTPDVKVEITPITIDAGSWKKWVKMEDMYVISEDINE